MAFKIGSIEELNKTADTMIQYAEQAEAETKKIVDAVEQLDSIVSGQGVDDSLMKLKDSINGNAQAATQTLKYVSLFIKSQAASSAESEETAANSLNNVENALNNMVI